MLPRKMVDVRVFVLPGGNLQIFVDNGTEKEAIEATKGILAQLQAANIALDTIGEIELHRTGGSNHVHVVTTVDEVQKYGE